MSQPVRVSVVPPKPIDDKSVTQPEDSVDLPNNVETDIMESVPPTMKSRARQLVKKLKENNDLITWDDKGQMIYEGKPVVGSNVIDLVNDALHHRKNFNPHGWRLFAKVLSDVNVPEGIVRNENRLKTIRDFKTGTMHELEEEPPTGPPLVRTRAVAKKQWVQLTSRPYKWFR